MTNELNRRDAARNRKPNNGRGCGSSQVENRIMKSIEPGVDLSTARFADKS